MTKYEMAPGQYRVPEEGREVKVYLRHGGTEQGVIQECFEAQSDGTRENPIDVYVFMRGVPRYVGVIGSIANEFWPSSTDVVAWEYVDEEVASA